MGATGAGGGAAHAWRRSGPAQVSKQTRRARACSIPVAGEAPSRGAAPSPALTGVLRLRCAPMQVFAEPTSTKEQVLDATPAAVTQLLAEIQNLSSRVIELEKRK